MKIENIYLIPNKCWNNKYLYSSVFVWVQKQHPGRWKGVLDMRSKDAQMIFNLSPNV